MLDFHAAVMSRDDCFGKVVLGYYDVHSLRFIRCEMPRNLLFLRDGLDSSTITRSKLSPVIAASDMSIPKSISVV